MTKIGIITALRDEARSFTREKLSPCVAHLVSDQVSLVLSGMGTVNVDRAIKALLAQPLEGLISFGTAGALDPSLGSGDIIVPERIVDTQGNTQHVSTAWRDSIIQQLIEYPGAVHSGDLLTTDSVIANTEAKKAIHEKTNALAVDMESAHITRAALSHPLPTVTLRIIVDTADMAIPEPILNSTDAYGQVSIPALLASILRQPLLVRDLLALSKAFRSAKQNMHWIGRHAERILLPAAKH